MDIQSFIKTCLPAKFQPDLSDSPLKNEIKAQLSEKIKQMHCQECISRGYKVCIALTGSDFLKVSVSEKVLLLSVTGSSYEEIMKNLDIETSIPLESYPNIIINFILNDKIRNPDTILKIYNSFQDYNTIHGFCLAPKSAVGYKIDIIAYK